MHNTLRWWRLLISMQLLYVSILILTTTLEETDTWLSRSQCLLFHMSFPSVLTGNILNYKKRKDYKLYSKDNHALSNTHIYTTIHIRACARVPMSTAKNRIWFPFDDDGSAYSARNFLWRYETCKKRCVLVNLKLKTV
jgi:hypothetical protein